MSLREGGRVSAGGAAVFSAEMIRSPAAEADELTERYRAERDDWL